MAAVLDAGPGQLGIEVVAAVHVDRTGGRAVRKRLAVLDVLGPYRRRQAIRAVIHEPDSIAPWPTLNHKDPFPTAVAFERAGARTGLSI
jgi:hypothetical protein